MKNDVKIFVAVTAVALVTAAVGHAVNPAFCMAVKPMSWPFLALAFLAGRHIVKNHKKEK